MAELSSAIMSLFKSFISYMKSESQYIIHKDHMNSTLMLGVTCDQKLTANGIGRFAVKALPGFAAGRGKAETLFMD